MIWSGVADTLQCVGSSLTLSFFFISTSCACFVICYHHNILVLSFGCSMLPKEQKTVSHISNWNSCYCKGLLYVNMNSISRLLGGCSELMKAQCNSRRGVASAKLITALIKAKYLIWYVTIFYLEIPVIMVSSVYIHNTTRY